MSCHSISYDPEADVCYRTLDFLGFPGYRVGDDGSVWSRLQRFGKGRGNGGGYKIGDKWTRLSPQPCGKKGHLFIVLCNNGRQRSFYVHRLVLLAFAGPCPKGMVACHRPDPRVTNNRVENLVWGTTKSNQADRIKDGTDGRGEKNAMAKLTEDSVRAIRTRHAAGGALLRELAAEFSISLACVSLIVNRKVWQHVV